jgi:hypothetical protein
MNKLELELSEAKDELIEMYEKSQRLLGLKYPKDYDSPLGKKVIKVKKRIATLTEQIAESKETVEPIQLRSELIKFACRNDKYNLDNVRTVDEPAMLEMYRKDHERSVDDYLKTK